MRFLEKLLFGNLFYCINESLKPFGILLVKVVMMLGGFYMMENLNQELIQIKSDLKRKHAWELQLEDYQNDLHVAREESHRLKNRLLDEKADVEKLEKLTVTNLFATLLGKKDERLEQENKEVIEVQLKLDAVNQSKKNIEQSIQDLQQKLLQVSRAEEEYEAILQRKEEMIKDTNSSYSQELFQLEEQEADTQAYLVELQEAIQAGHSVVASLDEAIESLEKASGWGTFDLFGGGLISDMVKHDHIDNAKQSIYNADDHMRKFQKELLDINESSTSINVDISGLLKFADFFFDGLIADWMVQGRINDSLEQTKGQYNKILNLVRDIKLQYEESESDLQQIQEQRKELIEKV